MAKEQTVQEMLQHVEMLLGSGEVKQASILLDHILRQDFTNPRAWQILYQVFGKGQLFEVFQRTFAQKYYSNYAYLLAPLEPNTPAAQFSADFSPKTTLEGTLHCPTCGLINRDGACFCSSCGAQFHKPSMPVSAPIPQADVFQSYLIPKQPHKRRRTLTWVWVLCGLAAFIVIFVVMTGLIYENKSNKTSYTAREVAQRAVEMSYCVPVEKDMADQLEVACTYFSNCSGLRSYWDQLRSHPEVLPITCTASIYQELTLPQWNARAKFEVIVTYTKSTGQSERLGMYVDVYNNRGPGWLAEISNVYHLDN